MLEARYDAGMTTVLVSLDDQPMAHLAKQGKYWAKKREAKASQQAGTTELVANNAGVLCAPTNIQRETVATKQPAAAQRSPSCRRFTTFI